MGYKILIVNATDLQTCLTTQSVAHDAANI